MQVKNWCDEKYNDNMESKLNVGTIVCICVKQKIISTIELPPDIKYTIQAVHKSQYFFCNAKQIIYKSKIYNIFGKIN